MNLVGMKCRSCWHGNGLQVLRGILEHNFRQTVSLMVETPVLLSFRFLFSLMRSGLLVAVVLQPRGLARKAGGYISRHHWQNSNDISGHEGKPIPPPGTDGGFASLAARWLRFLASLHMLAADSLHASHAQPKCTQGHGLGKGN